MTIKLQSVMMTYCGTQMASQDPDSLPLMFGNQMVFYSCLIFEALIHTIRSENQNHLRNYSEVRNLRANMALKGLLISAFVHSLLVFIPITYLNKGLQPKDAIISNA